MLRSAHGRRWLIHFFRHYEMPERPDVTEALANIDCPGTIIWGDDDTYCPWSTAVDLSRRLPRARLLRLAGADHFVMEERPDEVLEAMKTALSEPSGR